MFTNWRRMSFQDSMWLELFKAMLAAVLLLATWGIGQQIIAFWDIQKKRREFDLAAEMRFQELYGEFKLVSKLWRFTTNYADKGLPFPSGLRWQLAERATAAESRLESLILKLCTERVLNDDDQTALGLFRQAFQQLRESIRDDQSLKMSYSDNEYHFFNHLACRIAYIIFANPSSAQQLPIQYREHNLDSVMRVRSEDYKSFLGKYAAGRGAGVSRSHAAPDASQM
jgi:hypothetical protein